MVRVLFFVVCAASGLVLAGCESAQRGFGNEQAQLVAAPDSVSMMLAEAADKASNALEVLAAVEQARSPSVTVPPIQSAPPELRRAITVNWIGPAEGVAKSLADRAGYTFLTMGAPPPVPIIVSVDVQNKPVIDVLRDIGLQLGARADVKVRSENRTIEIQYPPNTGPGNDMRGSEDVP